MENDNKELCTISIMFEVESDEQALDCKKKIREALSNIPEARVEFSLRSIPESRPRNAKPPNVLR